MAGRRLAAASGIGEAELPAALAALGFRRVAGSLPEAWAPRTRRERKPSAPRLSLAEVSPFAALAELKPRR